MLPVSVGQHVPSRPTWLQVTQAPLQATLQQRPSVQNPDAQSASAAQAAPRDFFPQLPFTHLTPSTQSVSPAQVGKQALVLASQLYGAQTVENPALHSPLPSQTSTPVTAAPVQVPA
jgi:hypothetical protein